jgi:S-adenosyl methyltransferase
MSDEDAFRPDIASTARMYDYYLGGKDNYPVDREAAEKVITMMPPGTVRTAAAQNRGFLGRAVRYLAHDVKVRQFLDIGTGLPTTNPVHEVAQSVDPACRVVYVDHDPVVLVHAREMLDGVKNATIVGHDLREPSAIVGDPEVRALDFGQPVALLLVAVLHFISDDEKPCELIRTLMEPMASGSYLVISHATADKLTQLNDVTQVYEKATSRLSNRTGAEVAALFEGFELVEPGIVGLPDWRPDPDTGLDEFAGGSLFWCGVARKS